MNNILKLLFTISGVILFLSSFSQAEKNGEDRVHFGLRPCIAVPLYGKLNYVVLDEKTSSIEQTNLSKSPIYSIDAILYKKCFFFDFNFSYSKTSFSGKEFRQSFSYYNNPNPNPIVAWDFYAFQKVNYELFYCGIGLGYMHELDKKNNVEISLLWLLNYRRKNVVSNYFVEDKPITNIDNHELIVNTEVKPQSSTTLKNFGLKVAYNIFFHKSFSINAGIDLFYFQYKNDGDVSNGFNNGIFKDTEPYLLKYSIQKHYGLSPFLGVKLFL